MAPPNAVHTIRQCMVEGRTTSTARKVARDARNRPFG
jgi:hypothetical protein